MNTLLKENFIEDGCFHCSQKLPDIVPDALIGSLRRTFCCEGCKRVCEYIFGAGLEAFYEKREDARPETPPELKELLGQNFERTEFIVEREGLSEAFLMIEGIHCSACIWLIEKVVSELKGIRSARINFTTNRMTVRWTPDFTKIEDIVRAVYGVGYRAVPYDSTKGAEPLEREKRDLLSRIAVAAFGMLATMFFAEGLYAGYFWGIESGYRNLLQYLSLLVSIPVIFYAAQPILFGSYRALKARHVTMDLPVALGLVMTFFYSAWATLAGRSDVYFDCAAMFVFLILLGRYFEASAKKKARSDTERLFGLTPDSATIIRDGESLIVQVKDVTIGDILEVKPGEKIPLDGLVTYGEAEVDESMLTGESMPLVKRLGSEVFGGTTNTDGILRIRVTSTIEKTVLSEIRRLMEDAQLEKAAIEKFTDRVARFFVPAVLIAAFATCAVWLFIDPSRALIITVTVLIVTCPCALALAVPAAVITGTGRASRHGIIVKSSAVFENMSKATRVVFDKTGTLTEGAPEVTDVFLNELEDVDENFVIRVAAELETHSEHPLGKAIVNEAKKRLIGLNKLSKDFKVTAGRGVSGRLSNSLELQGYNKVTDVYVGSAAFMKDNGVEIPFRLLELAEALIKEAKSVVYVALRPLEGETKEGESRLLGLLALKDKLRPDAAEAVRALKQKGLSVTMLTGDAKGLAYVVARELGIDDIVSEVMPTDKERVIAGFKERGDNVIMVGDGINDGPALARADTGIAMGTGTGLAIESADMVLLNTRLDTLIKSIELSTSTIGTIRQNLFFSFAYNLILIPLAAFGLVIPLVAAIAMPLSSLFVIGNSIRSAGTLLKEDC
jgi:Cu2+-exporting ATPase